MVNNYYQSFKFCPLKLKPKLESTTHPLSATKIVTLQTGKSAQRTTNNEQSYYPYATLYILVHLLTASNPCRS